MRRIEQAVILAGGLGTRLGELSRAVPKPMVDVAGKPFLEHLLALLRDRGFREAVLLTGHLGEVVEAHFGDGSALGIRIRYSREPAALGTGGALLLARPILDEAFLLTYGDNWLPLDHRALVAAFERDRPAAMVTAHTGEGTDVPRNLAVRPDGRVLAYDKKGAAPGLNAVEAGVSVLTRGVLDLLPEEGPSSFEELAWPALAAEGRLRAFWTTERFYDIGTPGRLEAIRRHLGGRPG
ncbi:MAG TPA: sugar phosphate nucleotidyltransferase [Candidatus Thermoplasmatota archaeon]|nr:sugar phosphate nucleotidyltransferase [Candidatus Thermoplasmatota archaeon]